MIVHAFGKTDVGRAREHNEDAFAIADLSRGGATVADAVRTHEVGERGTLFMVADGMGGAAAGEIASEMAIDVVLKEVAEQLAKGDRLDEEQFASAIKRATASANAHIHAFALEHPEFRGMGTTATVAGVLGDTLYLAQVGDSRAYLIRNGVGQQITKDQSLMQKLIEAGELTEEEAEQSERRNIILQALGPEATIKVDLTHQRVRRGDTLVLCSDGLSGQVRVDEIARIVTEERDLAVACRRMIDRANENGGPDNITVIVARFEGEGLADPNESDDVGHRIFPLATDSGPTPAVDWAATTKPTPVTRPPKKILPDTLEFPILPEATMRRKIRGQVIALALLLLLLAGGFWWVYRTTAQVVAPRHNSVPGPSEPRP